jgi:hypothetical protein
MKPILQPGVGEAVAAEALTNFSQLASEAAPGALAALAEAVDEIPTAAAELAPVLEQLSGPMQQLMQPLQQLTSLAGQTGNMGGGAPGGLDALGNPADGDAGQIGLLGASPLSNHPLAGGSGPSVGMGLMHAESLPGAGGSASRTSLMSQLIDKPAPELTSAGAGAGAGSSAAGGAAPIGMTGAGAQSGAAAKPGLAAPTMLAQHQDEEGCGESGDLDDEDAW